MVAGAWIGVRALFMTLSTPWCAGPSEVIAAARHVCAALTRVTTHSGRRDANGPEQPRLPGTG